MATSGRRASDSLGAPNSEHSRVRISGRASILISEVILIFLVIRIYLEGILVINLAQEAKKLSPLLQKLRILTLME
jgi:hypothetical protein